MTARADALKRTHQPPPPPQPPITPTKRRTRGIIAAASLTALAVLVAPANNPLGIAALAGMGLLITTFYVKYLFGFDRTMTQRNANPGDPTLRKQIATFSLIPLSIATGSGLLYLGACLLPWGATPTFFVLAGMGLVYGIYKTLNAMVKTVRANRQTITPGYKSNPRQTVETNLLSYAVQGAEAAYMFYRGATIFELVIGSSAFLAHSIATTSLLSLGAGALLLGLPLFLVGRHYLRFTSEKWNELQHPWGPRLTTRKTILLAAGAAAAGALLWNFVPILINLAFALAFFVTEVHALVHNWSCQGGSREIIQTPPEEYSDTQIWNAARRPTSPWITVMKPGFEPHQFLIPTYALLYLRKGMNWDFIIISGINSYGRFMLDQFKETHQALEFLRGRQEAILAIIARHRTDQSSKLADRYEQLASLYEELANHWVAASRGDFSTMRSVRNPSSDTGEPYTPFAGRADVFTANNADNFEQYLGEAIRHEAEKFRDTAQQLRDRLRELLRDPSTTHCTHEEIDEHLASLTQQFSVVFHWFPPKQFRNICPDVIRSKIREIDLFNHLTMAFKTGASILRRNRYTGEYYWEILPCRRIRRLNTHTNTLSWEDRTDAEMASTESFSDIAEVDNRKMADPTGAVHTRQAYTYGTMREGESITIRYRRDSEGNVREETFTMRGGRIVVTDNGVARSENSDPVVWVPGMPEAIDPQTGRSIEAELPQDWRGEDGSIHAVFRPSLFHFFESRYQTMCDGEHADIITSDFLAPLEKDLRDPYIFVLWKVPEETTVPIPSGLRLIKRENSSGRKVLVREDTGDELVRISPSYANFCLRVKEKTTGRELYLPYNWMKNTRISSNIWTNIHYVRLMTREQFEQTYGVTADDQHGNKYANVIVPFDSNNQRIVPQDRRGNPLNRVVLPYSAFLSAPHDYEEQVEFDRGLGRIGDMNFVGYTFKRPDGTRYMRWLPREEDWPELEFGEEHESFRQSGSQIILSTCRWIGKRFYFDRHRLGLDPGTHENPNFEVLAIKGPEKFLSSIEKATSRFVLARYLENPGSISYIPFTGRIRNLDHVVDQRVNDTNLELVRITPDDKKVVALGNDQMLQHPSTWISSVSFNRRPNSNTADSVTLTFTNPFNHDSAGEQVIPLPQPVDLSQTYWEGENQAYLPRIFDQRQRNPQTGNVENRLFLIFYTCKTDTVQHGLSDLAPNEKIRLIEVKSSLRIRHLTAAYKKKGKEEWIPFDQAIPKATKSQIWFDPQNKPFSSGLCFGRVDTMIAPQHLVPVRSQAGPEWATDDQKDFFGEIYDESGEYNFPHGWIRGERRGRFYSSGPFSLQYAKSVRGAALNTGSNTVMRAPHHDLLFAREELEVCTRGGMPVPLYKSLYEKATTTEDAQGAWEKKRIFDLDTRMDRTVRSIGASVNNVGEGMGQRGRWAAMLQYLPRVKKIFKDELWRARIKKEIPPQYSNKQLHEWFNTFTWYLDTVFKHVIPVIPFAYMLGLSPLPAGAILFPLLWFIKTVTGWPKYSLDNQKMGISRFRSYFRNLALYYLYIPNISRNVSHINDEAKGPFLSTAGSGGRTFFPWAIRRIVYYFGGLSGITTAVGIYRMIAFGMTPFGLVMNVLWPALMFTSVCYALGMVWREIRHREPEEKGWKLLWKEFGNPLTVEWFRELRRAVQNWHRYQRTGEI